MTTSIPLNINEIGVTDQRWIAMSYRHCNEQSEMGARHAMETLSLLQEIAQERGDAAWGAGQDKAVRP